MSRSDESGPGFVSVVQLTDAERRVLASTLDGKMCPCTDCSKARTSARDKLRGLDEGRPILPSDLEDVTRDERFSNELVGNAVRLWLRRLDRAEEKAEEG